MNDDFLLEEQRAEQRHRHLIEQAATRNEKITRIEAKRDIKVAKIKSKDYHEMRAVRWGIVAAATALLGLAGCTASVHGFGFPDDQREWTKRINTCIEAGNEWDHETGDCRP